MWQRLYENRPSGSNVEQSITWISQCASEDETRNCGPKCLYILENLKNNKSIDLENVRSADLKMRYSLICQGYIKPEKPKKCVRFLDFEK